MKNLFRKYKVAQSTVELALILPILVLFLSMTIYVYRAHHTTSENTVENYAEEMTNYRVQGLVYDDAKGMYIPEGQFGEHIPPSGAIDPTQLARSVLGLASQLGLGELLSKLQIFDTSKYLGAFGQGFTYSLANSATQNFIQGGSWNDLSAQDLERASWAGAASSLSSDQAKHDFQGIASEGSSAQELLGSGAQAGLIGYAKSEGDWKAGVASAAGGMLNSDTTKGWMKEGDGISEVLKGAGAGAVQSSISGALNGKVEVKSVLFSAASGAVSTDAFAKAIPLTGSDAKNSAMYGAFNGAFSSVLSGGNLKNTLMATGAGALGSQQSAKFFGGAQSVGYRAAATGYGAGTQLATGQSAQAVGMGAISGLVSTGVGWAGNQVSGSIRDKMEVAETVNAAIAVLDDKQLVQDIALEENNDYIFEAVNQGMLNAQFMNSVLMDQTGDNDI